MNALKVASIGLAVSLAGAVAADDLREELQRCAELRNADVRLACYDALASVSASSANGSSADDGSVTEDAPAAVVAEAPAGTRFPEALDQGAPESDAEQSLAQRVFGMLPGGGEVREIESRVVGEVDGLGQGKRFELENGQVWRQIDPTKLNYRATNPRVEIKEGFMNSYRMRFEGLNARIRVRRVK